MMTIIVENCKTGTEFKNVPEDIADAISLLLKECASEESMIVYSEFEREVEE